MKFKIICIANVWFQQENSCLRHIHKNIEVVDNLKDAEKFIKRFKLLDLTPQRKTFDKTEVEIYKAEKIDYKAELVKIKVEKIEEQDDCSVIFNEKG